MGTDQDSQQQQEVVVSTRISRADRALLKEQAQDENRTFTAQLRHLLQRAARARREEEQAA